MRRRARQPSTLPLSVRTSSIDQQNSTYSNAHTASTRDQPAPHCRSRASRVERVGEGGHDRSKQAADTDGEGESRQVAKLSLEDGLVAELGGQLSISITQLGQIERLSLAIGAVDLDDAGALASTVGTISTIVELHVVRDFGGSHGAGTCIFLEDECCVGRSSSRMLDGLFLLMKGGMGGRNEEEGEER